MRSLPRELYAFVQGCTLARPAWTLIGLRSHSPRMPYPFAVREQWIDVTHEQFAAFLRDYPRPLEARPPMDRRARFREWCDPALGLWPDNAVAKSWVRGSCLGYQVRVLQP